MTKSNPSDKFRPPDIRWGYTYIWYGPGDMADEIENVTTVIGSGGDWQVTEYNFVGGYEMYEAGVREWIWQSVDGVEAKDARTAAMIGVAQISDSGGEEADGTTEDLINDSVLPPVGMTWKQWKKELKKSNPSRTLVNPSRVARMRNPHGS